MSKKILVVAAHPDDEILGCGGAVARHAAAGDEVHTIILATGLTSRASAGEAEIESLRDCAREANRILGVKSVEFGDFPDNSMDRAPLLDVVKFVERKIYSFAPEVVYTHHQGDVNIDHSVISRAVVTAARPLPNSSVRQLLFFEIPSSTEWQISGAASFCPNWFIDIGDFLEKKKQALGKYATEMRPWPHPRSLEAVEHLARWRGSTVGCEAAEAFVCGRYIEAKI